MFGRAASGTPLGSISASALSAAWMPAPWFAPRAARPSGASRSAASRAVTPASVSASSSNVSIATTGSDETLADAVDRVEQLGEVEERLDEHHVHAAPVEDRRLLGEDLAALRPSATSWSPSGPIEPATNTSRPETSRASRASFTAALLIALRLALEVVGRELAPVRAERVRLDQVRAGADEPEVQ